MIKNISLSVIIVLNILAIVYLLSPTPRLPDLSSSVKSELPGDTIQLEGVSGYFTNMPRNEVMDFYRSVYNSPLLIRLNHPPEKAKTIFRDTMQSYYLEELVIPFKESLYINGYEWENDVFTKPDKRKQFMLLYEGEVYKSKVNTKLFTTSIPKRLATFFLLELSVFSIIFLYRSFLKTKHD